MKRVTSLLAAFLWALGCAPRRELCAGPTDCGAFACIAGQCHAKDATSVYAGTRRMIVRPSDLAVLERRGISEGGALPAVFTLGAPGAKTELLLRFNVPLDRGASIVRAFVLLQRSAAVMSDPLPVAVHADRVIGRWNPTTVSWRTAPPIEDVRLPRTVIEPTTPSLIRVDVTELVRLWLAHDPRDQGLLIVAENETRTGVTFALGSTSLAELKESTSGRSDSPEAPRLEIYVR
jgi:hypothetical protein